MFIVDISLRSSSPFLLLHLRQMHQMANDTMTTAISTPPIAPAVAPAMSKMPRLPVLTPTHNVRTNYCLYHETKVFHVPSVCVTAAVSEPPVTPDVGISSSL